MAPTKTAGTGRVYIAAAVKLEVPERWTQGIGCSHGEQNKNVCCKCLMQVHPFLFASLLNTAHVKLHLALTADKCFTSNDI